MIWCAPTRRQRRAAEALPGTEGVEEMSGASVVAVQAEDEASRNPLRRPIRVIIYNRMVVRHPPGDADLDRVFRALADATRRDIVARLLGGEPMSVSALAARYDMSFAAVQKHVTVLEGAGLVTKHPQGRERIVRGIPERIARVRDVLAQLEGLWRARFSQLDAVLTERHHPE